MSRPHSYFNNLMNEQNFKKNKNKTPQIKQTLKQSGSQKMIEPFQTFPVSMLQNQIQANTKVFDLPMTKNSEHYLEINNKFLNEEREYKRLMIQLRQFMKQFLMNENQHQILEEIINKINDKVTNMNQISNEFRSLHTKQSTQLKNTYILDKYSSNPKQSLKFSQHKLNPENPSSQKLNTQMRVKNKIQSIKQKVRIKLSQKMTLKYSNFIF